MPENGGDVCRLCLSNEGLMLPIFRSCLSKNETTFRFKIMSCTSIEIFADDNLPSKICYMCVHQIEKFFQFQNMCAKSDVILHSQLNSCSSNSEVSDSKIKNDGLDHQCSNEKSALMPDIYTEDCVSDKKVTSDITSCFVCSSTFLSSDLLVEHLTKIHTNINVFQCIRCKISFSNVGQYKNHLKFEHNLTCDHCDYVFKYQESLQEHLKIHFKDNSVCKFCTKAFNNIAEMRKHEFMHLEKICRFCLNELDTKLDCYSHTEGCTQKYYCSFCEQEVKFKKDLINHVNSCHDTTLEKCENCQKTYTKSKHQKHECDNQTDIIQCKHCQSFFTDKGTLMTHMAVHESDELLACKFCTKKFSLKSSLRRHEKSHSGLKPHQCKYCPRKFKDSSTCIVHMRTHTGEHPFQCQECHKDFKQLANLKMHTYRHHKKNLKIVEKKNEIMHEISDNFEQLCTEGILGTCTTIGTRNYQNLTEDITNSISSNINILISNQR